MTPPKSNGLAGMTTWMLRTSVGLLIAILMAWAGFLHAQIGDLRTEDRGMQIRMGQTKDQIMSKVSSLEPGLAALQTDVATVKRRLESIDSKIDRVLTTRRRDR